MSHIRRLLCKLNGSVYLAVLIVACGSSSLTGCGHGGGGSSALPVVAEQSVAGMRMQTSAAEDPLVTSALDSSAVDSGALDLNSPDAVAASAARYDTTVLSDKPVGFYRMNDTTTIMHDDARDPKSGTHGALERLGVKGITSTNEPAVSFPGGNYAASRVARVDATAKLQPGIVSVEAWVSPSAPNTSNRYQPMVAYGRFSTGTPYHLTITPINQFFFSVHTTTGRYSIVARTTSWPGRIFHVVGTFDGSSLKLYVNGILEGHGTGSGRISYNTVLPWTGLAIGSGLDALAAHPIQSYAGTIEDVSIYNKALTSAQVVGHYLSGVATPLLKEHAASADSFIDSIGVNAPFNYQSTVYDVQFGRVKSLLVASGIRHIRSGLAQTTWTQYYDRLNELGRAGVHSQLVTHGKETASQLKAFPARVADSMEAFEGPNEPELSYVKTHWVSDTRNFMRLMHSAIKGNAATARFPIMGPSVVVPSAATELGNLSADLDYGNIHPYYGRNNPGNTGTGSITSFGRSGSTAYYMNVGRQISGSKPMVATETGYSTEPVGKGNVSELCDGKEMPRTFLVHFMHGMKRTFTYQFVESGTSFGALGSFSYMGLVRQNLTPKPSYTAIKSLATLLSDKGGVVSTSTLAYTIRGNVNNLAHLLMQKRNGSYYLALWLEVPSWSWTLNADVNAPPQLISVNLPTSVKSATVYSLSDTGNMSGSGLVLNQGTAALSIRDRVTVLAFRP